VLAALGRHTFQQMNGAPMSSPMMMKVSVFIWSGGAVARL
jgi:hypothetical protein